MRVRVVRVRVRVRVMKDVVRVRVVGYLRSRCATWRHDPSSAAWLSW